MEGQVDDPSDWFVDDRRGLLGELLENGGERLGGELDGDYFDWTPRKGFHTLTASALDADPEALDGPALTINFNVVDRASAPTGSRPPRRWSRA